MPEITADRLDEWRRSLRARRKLSARSTNAYLTLLRAICRLAVRTGRLQVDPTARLRPYPEHRGEVSWLTEEQLEAVLAAARGLQEAWAGAKPHEKGTRRVPIYDLVVTLYHSAARTGNVLALTWAHVDWSSEVLVWQPREVKNRKRIVVPIIGRLREVLLERFPGDGAAGFVFPDPDDPERHLSHRALRLAWRDVLEAAKLPTDFKVYNLRHTRATHVLRATGDPVVAAELLGDNVAMVLKRYAGRSPDRLREALERAGRSRSQNCPNAGPQLGAAGATRRPKLTSGVQVRRASLLAAVTCARHPVGLSRR